MIHANFTLVLVLSASALNHLWMILFCYWNIALNMLSLFSVEKLLLFFLASSFIKGLQSILFVFFKTVLGNERASLSVCFSCGSSFSIFVMTNWPLKLKLSCGRFCEFCEFVCRFLWCHPHQVWPQVYIHKWLFSWRLQHNHYQWAEADKDL